MVQRFNCHYKHDWSDVSRQDHAPTPPLPHTPPFSDFLYVVYPSFSLSAIFYTIRRYGPIVFTVIMTTRQMLSIVLSTVLFGHTMGPESVLGALVVFLAVFHSIHRQVKENQEKKKAKEAEPVDQGGDSKGAGISKDGGGLEMAPASGR